MHGYIYIYTHLYICTICTQIPWGKTHIDQYDGCPQPWSPHCVPDAPQVWAFWRWFQRTYGLHPTDPAKVWPRSRRLLICFPKLNKRFHKWFIRENPDWKWVIWIDLGVSLFQETSKSKVCNGFILLPRKPSKLTGSSLNMSTCQIADSVPLYWIGGIHNSRRTSESWFAPAPISQRHRWPTILGLVPAWDPRPQRWSVVAPPVHQRIHSNIYARAEERVLVCMIEKPLAGAYYEAAVGIVFPEAEKIKQPLSEMTKFDTWTIAS